MGYKGMYRERYVMKKVRSLQKSRKKEGEDGLNMEKLGVKVQIGEISNDKFKSIE